MEDALRVVVEMNETIWDRLKGALEDLSEEEIQWRPLPQANSINVIIRPHTWRCTVARSARFVTCTAKRVESPRDSSRRMYPSPKPRLDEFHVGHLSPATIAHVVKALITLVQ